MHPSSPSSSAAHILARISSSFVGQVDDAVLVEEQLKESSAARSDLSVEGRKESSDARSDLSVNSDNDTAFDVPAGVEEGWSPARTPNSQPTTIDETMNTAVDPFIDGFVSIYPPLLFSELFLNRKIAGVQRSTKQLIPFCQVMRKVTKKVSTIPLRKRGRSKAINHATLGRIQLHRVSRVQSTWH